MFLNTFIISSFHELVVFTTVTLYYSLTQYFNFHGFHNPNETIISYEELLYLLHAVDLLES